MTQGGILWVPQARSDVFFVDLHKAERDYSPTTMYRDYAINRELFHWESQSRQTPRQPTVERYINHRSQGTRILLFVRERKTFELGTQPFTFLGPADYVEHHGERPVAFTWRLPVPMPRRCSKPPGASQLPSEAIELNRADGVLMGISSCSSIFQELGPVDRVADDEAAELFLAPTQEVGGFEVDGGTHQEVDRLEPSLFVYRRASAIFTGRPSGENCSNRSKTVQNGRPDRHLKMATVEPN